MSWSPFKLSIKGALLTTLILAAIQTTILSQEVRYTKPALRFGISAGANVNFYRGTTRILNSDFTAPVDFHLGQGVGLFAAPLIEYHHPDRMLGVMLQAGYDNRSGEFDKQTAFPCNCPADVSTDLSYFTIEPSLRIAPFKGNFYLYGGPRFAFNIANDFKYQEYVNPNFPNELPDPDIEGEFDNVNSTVFSMQVGAGYDIPLSSQNMRTQFVLSPFVAYHPDFRQAPRSSETWSINTFRAGASLKVGFGREIPADVEVIDTKVRFTVTAPKNIPVERSVREIFPLRNYVFFNEGSTAIPDRYVLLNKGQVADFKEDQLGMYIPKNLSGRSDRQMTVYYNVLNILGDRMGKVPASTITLVGSSSEGPEDGRAMAESVKTYLVDVFAINASRIAIEGRVQPKIPSGHEHPGTTPEQALLHEDDRRVSIESSAPLLLMEYQNTRPGSLRPVEIMAVQNSPLDSYVTFNVDGARDAFSSWSVEVMDDKGKVQYFGPYTHDRVSIPGKSILGMRPEGDYKVTMVGLTKNGKTVRETTNVHMVLRTLSTTTQAMRYSVLYEFDDAETINLYAKYLTDLVTPSIPMDATVFIHGYTDIIGEEDYNETLSLARANDVKNILSGSLTKAGRTDVKFQVYGFGENPTLTPFNDKLPEERFYNRTVVIDIIPGK